MTLAVEDLWLRHKESFRNRYIRVVVLSKTNLSPLRKVYITGREEPQVSDIQNQQKSAKLEGRFPKPRCDGCDRMHVQGCLRLLPKTP